MNIFDESTIEILEILLDNGVRFILVGGLAVNYSGFSRTTGDIDIWLKDSPENRQKLIAALKSFGIKGAEIFEDFPLKAGFAEVLLDNGMYLDMMSDLQFFKQENFEDCYTLASEWKINSQQVKIL